MHDKSHGDRLHAARRLGEWADLLPQHFGDGVAVEPIEDATGLLRIDEFHVDVAGVGDGLADRVLGDLVEDHAADRDLGAQHLHEVPGDGLALAVLVRSEQECVGVLESLLQIRDGLRL